MGHNNLKQAAALMAVAGILDADKACNDVIAINGAAGFSTFYGLYMLDAPFDGRNAQRSIGYY